MDHDALQTLADLARQFGAAGVAWGLLAVSLLARGTPAVGSARG